MKVYRAGSEIRVLLSGKNVVSGRNGFEVVLTRDEAEKLLNELAKLLPYRVLKLVRDVVVEEVRSGEAVVRYSEGTKVKVARIPFDTIKAHIDVLKEVGAGNTISKREYARLVVERASKCSNKPVADLAKSNLPFSWETFLGRRHDYYVLYYMPLLLLRRAGFVDVRQLTIEVLDVPASVKQLIEYVKEEV